MHARYSVPYRYVSWRTAKQQSSSNAPLVSMHAEIPPTADSEGDLVSADSMAWSFDARRKQRPLCGSTTHKNCANCLTTVFA